ncbi:MAG TPA: hypothetical protein VHU44_00280 [Acidobacteriaceae bacterium]|jgi:hypothetical protein|nr:hypothetical protein [Acidobacteriaceae bacterium]
MSAGLQALAETGQGTGQFGLKLAFVVNLLPLWFLVFALFLPRIAMAVAWVQGVLVPFHLGGIVPPLFWLFLPRILVLYLIYVDQGLTLWFLVHLVVALLVWGGGGHQMRRRSRRDY